MARRRGSAGGWILVAVLAAIGWGLDIAMQHPVATTLLVAGALALWIWLRFGSSDSDATGRSAAQEPHFGGGFASARTPSHPVSREGDAFWVPPGAPREIHGVPVGSGLYVGTGLAAIGSDDPEPALIDPTLPVSRHIRDCTVRRTPYWPSYSTASPDARAAYLHWLRTGREDPQADLGYVFLYFYGLERRALHDALSSPAAAAGIPDIEREVVRLLGIYRENRSFDRYATAFLDFLAARRAPQKRYGQRPAGLAGQPLHFTHRLALAQCAADGAPLRAAWAYHWVCAQGLAHLPTPARRCPQEFHALFEKRYRDRYGAGMILRSNRTRLRLEYRAASASFRGASAGLSMEFDLPDVSVLTGPTRKLEELATEVCGELDRYSRRIAKTPDAANSFEALVELPMSLWPAQFREPLENLREVIERAGQPAAIPFAKLRSWLPAFTEVTRAKMRSLSLALAGAGLGMEPDVRFGASTPDADSRIVLFARDPRSDETDPSPRYLAASLTLHLAVAVMAADGDVADSEKNLLVRQLEDWLHLDDAERRRLHAHLRFLVVQPPRLTGLKSRIEALEGSARAALADFLAAVAQVDGKVTPQEIRTLQKVFKLLTLDPNAVYSKLHSAATEPVTVRTSQETERNHRIPPPPKPRRSREADGIQLDPVKVAALQKDSERVAALLASVFETPLVEPELAAAAVSTDSDTDAEEESQKAQSRLGLDAIHTSFLEILVTRREWRRAELEELAEDRALMLDGALEQINDASFEHHEAALFEGDDPIQLNPDVVQEIVSGEHQTA